MYFIRPVSIFVGSILCLVGCTSQTTSQLDAASPPKLVRRATQKSPTHIQLSGKEHYSAVMLGNKNAPPHHVSGAEQPPARCMAPADWANRLPPAFNQGSCGDCYAFGSMGYVAGLFAAQYGSATSVALDPTVAIMTYTNAVIQAGPSGNLPDQFSTLPFPVYNSATNYNLPGGPQTFQDATCGYGGELLSMMTAMASLPAGKTLCGNQNDLNGTSLGLANSYNVGSTENGATQYIMWPLQNCTSGMHGCNSYVVTLSNLYGNTIYPTPTTQSGTTVYARQVANLEQALCADSTTQPIGSLIPSDVGSRILSRTALYPGYANHLSCMEQGPIVVYMKADDLMSMQGWGYVFQMPASGQTVPSGPMQLSNVDFGNHPICIGTSGNCTPSFVLGDTDHVLLITGNSPSTSASADFDVNIRNSWSTAWGYQGYLGAQYKKPTSCSVDADCLSAFGSQMEAKGWKKLGWTTTCQSFTSTNTTGDASNNTAKYCVATIEKNTPPPLCSATSPLPQCPDNMQAAGGRCTSYYYTNQEDALNLSPTTADVYCVPSMVELGVTDMNLATLYWRS